VPIRLFTLSDANDLIPTLEPLMCRVMAKRRELQKYEEAVEAFQAKASRDGGILPGADYMHVREESTRILTEIREGVQEIEAFGCLVKDIDIGVVDFPARRGHEQVFLCWRLGEPTIQFWRNLREGFASRKPVREDLIG
jgi:hypothetical protein